MKRNWTSNLKHGMYYTRFYRIWKGLQTRVNNPNTKGYKFYGGRGIKCEWKSFEKFKKDMYKDYVQHVKDFGEKNTTLDRINNNGNYSNKNCKWATLKEQYKNRPQTKKYKGKTLREWSEIKGFKLKALQWRIYKKDSIQEAIKKLTSKAETH